MTSRYDNAYEEDNVYGHTVALLSQHVLAEKGRIHLDLACGTGAVGGVVTDRLGLTYVGVDVDPDAIRAIQERGQEAHRVDLSRPDIHAVLARVIGDRRVASVSFLDGLEHIGSWTPVLDAIAEIAFEHRAPVVISVPNVAHWNLSHKLLFGQWDYTPTGLLDSTHIEFFTHEHLRSVLASRGLHPVAEKNVQLERSDQAFPAEHPAIASGTVLHQLLRHLRSSADEHSRVNQFVWLCTPGAPTKTSAIAAAGKEEEGPFLSVLTRTQGTRIPELNELITCLSGQEDADFELLILGHKLTVQNQVKVEQLIADQPETMRSRIRLILVDHGTRTTPLKVGLRQARGTYFTVLDDDDLVFGNWVSEFRRSHERRPGAIHRGVAVIQHAKKVTVRGGAATTATGGFVKRYSNEFSFISHLVENETPLLAAALPRSIFTALGLDFDETLTTTEDWDLLMRSAAIVGVADTRAVSSVYRWWVDNNTSQTVHSATEWALNHKAVDRKLNSSPLVLAPGDAERIRTLVTQNRELRTNPSATSWEGRDRDLHLARIAGIIDSRSWRVAAPLRLVGRLVGAGRPFRMSDVISADSESLKRTIVELESSRSWRITKHLRRS